MIHDVISNELLLWASANWALLIFPLFLIVLTANPAAWGIAGVWLFAGGLSQIAAFVAGTMQERNLYMLTQMESVSADEEIDVAELITGGAHEEGLREHAPRFGLNVID